MLLAAPRGYCAGVDRAVVTVEKALELYGPPVYVRKQIVHNRTSSSSWRSAARSSSRRPTRSPRARSWCSPRTAWRRRCTRRPQQRRLRTIDATCPLVTKVHLEARRFAEEGFQILLIGHDGHEEVVGTTGEAPDHVTLVDGPESVDAVDVPDPERVAWLSQTTLSVDETEETVRALRTRFPALLDPPSDDICYATQNRQEAVKLVAADADLVIVVGSRNSSNSVRLVEVARTAGASAAYLVDAAEEIDDAWLDGVTTVGVTSGASVPEVLVDGVLAWLAERGYGDVERGGVGAGAPAVRAAAGAAPRPQGRRPGLTVSAASTASATMTAASPVPIHSIGP